MWAVGTGVAHSSIPQIKYEVSHGIFSDSDFLFSLCFIYIFNGTPWQFIFFFGTCYVPAVNPGLPGGKLVVAHIKSVCYMPCFSASVNTFIIPIILENCN